MERADSEVGGDVLTQPSKMSHSPSQGAAKESQRRCNMILKLGVGGQPWEAKVIDNVQCNATGT